MFKVDILSEEQKIERRQEALESLEGIFTPELALFIRDRIRAFEGQLPVLDAG